MGAWCRKHHPVSWDITTLLRKAVKMFRCLFTMAFNPRNVTYIKIFDLWLCTLHVNRKLVCVPMWYMYCKQKHHLWSFLYSHHEQKLCAMLQVQLRTEPTTKEMSCWEESVQVSRSYPDQPEGVTSAVTETSSLSLLLIYKNRYIILTAEVPKLILSCSFWEARTHVVNYNQNSEKQNGLR